eukprot:752053-Hanusia_phi.AAC.1
MPGQHCPECQCQTPALRGPGSLSGRGTEPRPPSDHGPLTQSPGSESGESESDQSLRVSCQVDSLT